MSSLGERLKVEREKRGWSQVLVSQKLGIKRSSTYANWEYGIREPDADMLRKLSEIYEVSADYLIGKSDTPSVKKETDKDLLIKEALKNLSEEKKQLLIDVIKQISNN